ncbi:fumarylacetoacetate hydrolase family protein [Myxococcota bacterium]|nr:fumarylacetoacetate hydrolase family protein [Myxococcota bacterium]
MSAANPEGLDAGGLRLARYQSPSGAPRLARVYGWGTPDAPLRGVRLQPVVGDILGHVEPTGEEWLDAAQARLLPPLLPSKVIGIGSNYRAHAAEMGRPLPTVPKVFLKPPSAVVAFGEPILLPPGTERVDHEAELALVIGRHLSRVSPEQAMAGVAGLTCLNDVTARDLQKADGVFARAKGFDSFCPLGPWITRGLQPGALAVRCRVRGRDGAWVTRQDGRADDMVFDPATLVSFVSQVMSLWPGDVIATGTPAGVGPLQAGDRVQVEIEGVGILENPVQDRDDRAILAGG